MLIPDFAPLIRATLVIGFRLSLRAKRSNPARCMKPPMDCFVALLLAMTETQARTGLVLAQAGSLYLRIPCDPAHQSDGLLDHVSGDIQMGAGADPAVHHREQHAALA